MPLAAPPSPEAADFARVLRQGALWAPAALLVLGSVVLAGAVQFDPGDSVRLVALFPPWWSQAQAIAAAAETGPVTGISRSGFAVGVIAVRPGVAAALRARGALLVADGRAFPSCFPSTHRTPSP